MVGGAIVSFFAVHRCFLHVDGDNNMMIYIWLGTKQPPFESKKFRDRSSLVVLSTHNTPKEI